MKGRAIHHRDYEAANTEKDGFALLTNMEGISIGIEVRRNTVVLVIKTKDQYTEIRQGNTTLMEYYDKVKSKLVALERVGATLYDACIGHDRRGSS